MSLKIRLSILGAILSWLLFMFFDIYYLLVDRYDMNVSMSHIVPQIFLTSFVVCVLVYYRFIISKAESVNFIDLLWRVFLTGLVTTVISLSIRLFLNIFQNNAIIQSEITLNVLYHIVGALVIIFLVSTFIVWKRLILYQKSKSLIQLWNFFEYALLASLLFDFFGNKLMTTNFNIFLIFLLGFALVLSFNLKWIAYLNFKQKWKSILFILLSAVYVYHFLLFLITFTNTGALTLDLLDRIFVVALLVFILLYAVISILVTLFNLPTSSVFERKLQEAIDYQKLSQAIPSGQSIDQTFDVLLDSSMSAVFADAAWIEMDIPTKTIVTRSIAEEKTTEIRKDVKSEYLRSIFDREFKGNFSLSKASGVIRHPEYKSIIALPIMVKGKQEGALILLQEVADAFNREMVDIIVTFVSQASVSLENFQLISEALENERYKEQLKIAKNVQKSLLPSKLISTKDFTLDAISFAADEVGGDYYDIVDAGDGLYKLIIADVSGKGTSAAFNMAQMKGVFHSLTQNNDGAIKFIIRANAALGECLETSSFITATYFEIDTKKKEINFVRAGHCPTLFYKHETQEASYFKTEGLGLGIVRNSDYTTYVEGNSIHYHPGDILLLYTDGITEARNRNAQQFGSDGLRDALLENDKGSPSDLRKGIIKDLDKFLDGNKLDDDYTLVTLKFLC
ncbi:MAG: GAF domain-containing SpoIIE family protein phosphatase [Bacteroidota bacterium]